MSALAQTSSSKPVDAKEILERHRASILNLSTLSFTSDTLFQRKTNPLQPDQHFVTRYTIKGEYVYTDRTKWESPESEPLRVIQAFNGEQYQAFYPESQVRELHVSKSAGTTRPFLDARQPALLEPYLYTAYEKIPSYAPSVAYPVLTDSEMWDTINQVARTIGTETYNDMFCTVLELRIPNADHPDKPHIRLVYCAEQFNFYPVHWEEHAYFSDVGEYKLFSTVDATEIPHSSSKCT